MLNNQDSESDFKAFVASICKRLTMYTLSGSFKEVAACISGYEHATSHKLFGAPNTLTFSGFVCRKLSFPRNYFWTAVIQSATKSDEEAIAKTASLITEFLDLKTAYSNDEIIAFALRTAEKPTNGEPEKIYRLLSQAILRGDQKVIEPLIQAHERAAVLWRGAYSSGVVEQLEATSNEQPIRRIYESEDGGKVRLLTAGLPFQMEVDLINGEWKVNAEPIIDLWMSHTA